LVEEGVENFPYGDSHPDKMSKRIHSHHATSIKSIFHQILIKVLVVYALDEVNRSWDWLLESLELKEQKPKPKLFPKHKSTKEKRISKTLVSTEKESSPMVRVTRYSKRKLKLQ
jgi:hypothetical protein